MGSLGQDLRYAFRIFRKSPVFVAVAVLSLAFGIGANTAIFTLVDQLLLRLLPVKHPEQLVTLWGRGDHYGGNNGMYKLSYPMYVDFRDKNQVFNGMCGSWDSALTLNFEGHTERVAGQLVTGTYFPLLGVGAALGRVFGPEVDDVKGGHPEVVLSYRYWITRFAGDPSVIGKKLSVNGFPMTIVGVSQAGFEGTDPASSPQIRVPILMEEATSPQSKNLEDRRFRWVNVFGRLKEGETLQQARSGLQPLFHQIIAWEVQQKEFAKTAPITREKFLRMWLDLLPASSGRSGMRDRFSKPLLVLTWIVALVLLIACANLANLLIARAAARQKEIAVRLALGAKQRRIVTQLLVESLTLSLAGGAAGLAIAWWIDRALIGIFPTGAAPLPISTTPDERILAFNLGISFLTGIVFGLMPALRCTRPNLAPTLKSEVGSIAGGGAVGLRKALVAGQVGLSLLLLIGAGLFIRSLEKLKDLDPGFQTRNLLTFAVDASSNGYPPERSMQFYRQLKENLDAMPGVEASSLAVVPVLENNEWDNWMSVENFSPKPGEWIDPHVNYVSPDYFRTLGVPILAGRDFRSSDDANAPKVAIVNEKFAKQYLHGDALGRHLGLGGDPGTKLDIEIIGVVRDSKYENMRDEMPIEVFTPYFQRQYVNSMSVYVRTARAPEEIFPAVRGLINRLDPNVPIYRMKTLVQAEENTLVIERLVATLSSGFGIVATLLAAIGLYAVMAFTVAQRTREIGVRMALGAASSDVLWLVMKEVLTLAAIGAAVGLAGAWGLTRFAKSQLYGIEPNDAVTILAATLGILLIAILSGYLPARRAALVDPMRALRWE
jgi:predicted permease